ncbi:MAG: lysostaphin resistance A-like protein [Ectobacillus sp.]
MGTKTYQFCLSLVLAYILLACSFWLAEWFWVLFSVSLFTLIGLAYIQERIVIKRMNWREVGCGLLSGTLLYLIFAFGKQLIVWLQLPLLESLSQLYETVSPRVWWHYVMLFLVIIPGEELFWRNYVQKRLTRVLPPGKGILLGTLLYAGAHIWSGSVLLVIAALVGGVFWGWLYERTGKIEVAILSHLVFDVWLLILLPLL